VELKEFIKQSITQISEALIETNDELQAKGVVVNPGRVQVNSDTSQAYGRLSNLNKHQTEVVQKIDFDIAVTVQDEQKAGAGAKISVLSLKLGADGSVNYANKSESRIKFIVPIIYPEGDVE
jgi:hypothetical protein